AAGEIEAVIPLDAGPQLALAEDIAVALAVVGGNAGAQEVAFVVAGDFPGPNFGFEPKGGAGLARGGGSFAGSAEGGVRIGNAGKGRVDVGSGGAGTRNGCGLDETTGSNADALIFDRRWTVVGLRLVLRGFGRFHDLGTNAHVRAGDVDCGRFRAWSRGG